MKKIPIMLIWLLIPIQAWAVYNVPSGRRITWNAGLDPIGGIPTSWPNCTTSACNTLYAKISGDITSAMNAALTSAPAHSVVRVHAGNFTVSGNINMVSNVILRGAKSPLTGSAIWLPTADASATTLNIGGNNIRFNGGDQSSTWSPGPGQGTAIIAGYTQGSTSLTLSSASGYNVNDYISVYQNSDSSLPIDYRGMGYLGEDNCDSYDCHVKQQYVQITAINGNTITINPGIYLVTASPTGQAARKLTWGITMAGLENIRLNGNGTGAVAVWIKNALYCWVKGVESYNCAGGNGFGHIETYFSKGIEIRDSYIHTGGTHQSGRSYGIDFYYWNSDHKIENNIVIDTRHAIIFEGGGSGCAILYNYGWNNYEAENTAYLSESLVQDHGAHPHMNLWEGNIDQQFYGDWTQGSSSHITEFRNAVWGYRDTPDSLGANSIAAIRVGPYSRYYNLVGNVAGRSAWTGGVAICNSATCGNNPHSFEFGLHTNGTYPDSGSYSTAILQGNYDYVTKGVAVWADPDHTLTNSMYYSSKPSWYGGCTWPPVDPTIPNVADIPAKLRYTGSNCPSSNPTPFGSNKSQRRTMRGCSPY